MTTQADMRSAEMLAELSELGLVLARDLQAAALAAEDVSEKTELALAFQRTARAVRQSLGLKARFSRDQDRAEREALVEAQRSLRLAEATEQRLAAAEAADTPARRRRDQVERAVSRCIAAEYDGYDTEPLDDTLSDFLDEDMARTDFLAHPIEGHIRRLCADLGVEPPKPRTRWPDPPAPAEAAARSAEGGAPAPSPSRPGLASPSLASPSLVGLGEDGAGREPDG